MKRLNIIVYCIYVGGPSSVFLSHLRKPQARMKKFQAYSLIAANVEATHPVTAVMQAAPGAAMWNFSSHMPLPMR